MNAVDLNADLGEGFPNDAALLARVTSASVSCGAHAGDRATILATLRQARARGVAVGAHPGYADRAAFGRREHSCLAAEVETLVLDQFSALSALAAEAGVVLGFVKPHGALYNQAQREEEIAAGVTAAVARLGLPVLGQPGSVLEIQARKTGTRFLPEGFPDRRYRPDGRLVSRSNPDALLQDSAEIEAQVVRLIAQGVATLCIHGDDPNAVANADTVRAILARRGIALRAFS